MTYTKLMCTTVVSRPSAYVSISIFIVRPKHIQCVQIQLRGSNVLYIVYARTCNLYYVAYIVISKQHTPQQSVEAIEYGTERCGDSVQFNLRRSKKTSKELVYQIYGLGTCHFELQKVYLDASPGKDTLHSSHENEYLGACLGDYSNWKLAHTINIHIHIHTQ